MNRTQYRSRPLIRSAPVDDGAAEHLLNHPLPKISLLSTQGTHVDLCASAQAVVFAYPRTGIPGCDEGAEWEAIPGVFGCTAQSCGFRDLIAPFIEMGVEVYGISTQTTAYQREFANRMNIPYDILSDADLMLTNALRLPTFEFNLEAIGGGGPNTLNKRIVLYIQAGVIRHVWYPVYPPETSAEMTLAWLRSR